MCTVLLPPGGNPTAVKKHIFSYHINFVVGKLSCFGRNLKYLETRIWRVLTGFVFVLIQNEREYNGTESRAGKSGRIP
jgi:hypothetical protein